MLALVTGSDGFIGSRLELSLKLNGFDVTGLEKGYLQSKSVTRSLGSFLNRNKPDVIFHVGADSNTLQKNVQVIMEANFLTSSILSDWCKLNSIPCIFSSSASIYGGSGEMPTNLYGWSKFTAERLIVAQGGIALRYFNVFGPGESHKGPMASVFFQAFMKSKTEERFKLFPGKPKRDFVYIDDVVLANIMAAESFSACKGKFFDVGTGKSKTFEEGLNIMGLKYSYSSIRNIPNGYQRNTRANPKNWVPGWKPKRSFEESIQDYLRQLNAIYS